MFFAQNWCICLKFNDLLANCTVLMGGGYSLSLIGRYSQNWAFSGWPLMFAPQRQVRHPFVHDLQDCWQTQRHLYISESARRFSVTQSNPNPLSCPVSPHSPKTHRRTASKLLLIVGLCTPPRNTLLPPFHFHCPLSPSSRALAFFFFQISRWLRKCDPLCLPPHPLWDENLLAWRPDVECCCSSATIHVTLRKEEDAAS